LEKGTWGIVADHEARVYTLEGKFLGRVNAGSLVTILRKAKSGSKQFAVCRSKADPDPFLMAEEDLHVYAGSFEGASTESLGMCVRYAELAAEKARIEKDIAKTGRTDNPHHPEYKVAKHAYVSYWKKVKELTRLREEADSSDRIRYGDELRELKGEDIRVGQAYEAAKQRYEQWNAAHPAAGDPRIRKLQDEIERLEARITGANEGS